MNLLTERIRYMFIKKNEKQSNAKFDKMEIVAQSMEKLKVIVAIKGQDG